MSEPPQAPSSEGPDAVIYKPDWGALRLINQYRLLLVLALAIVYYFSEDQRILGSRNGDLFEVSHLAYLVLTLGFILLNRIQKPAITIQFFVQNYLDILLISTLMYASGGITSGLGPLLLINLVLLSQLASTRHVLLFAAIASMAAVGEELLAKLLLENTEAHIEATAILSALLFATVWVMCIPVRILMRRRLVKSSRSRAMLDVQQLTQLNEEIIRELDSGVVVINQRGHVILINDTARALLGAEFTPIPAHLHSICQELLQNLNESLRSNHHETQPFTPGSTSQSLLPRYIPLSRGGMLIKLDDQTHIQRQFQQLKLASLGRLSASIAHEIRHPLGAISHAVQLIQKSAALNSKDAELLNIAKLHTLRIDRVIEDVMQLSNRQCMRSEVVSVDTLIQDFAKRFAAEHALDENRLDIVTEASLATIDPAHLNQMLWNLCTNAQLHNQNHRASLSIHCRASSQGGTVIDIKGNGRGISDIDRENLFEPFYATHHADTGLGLFIIRELCELNKAQIECLDNDGGTHFRITLTAAQDMAA